MMIGICALLLSTTSAFSDNSLNGVKKGTLTVVANGFKSNKGFAMFGLCNTAECFNNAEEKALLPQKVQIINGKATHDFKGVLFGEYAVTVYHDENGNGKLDKGLFGKPLELYGFSNNARGIISRPDYKKAAFVLDKADMTITIHVE